MHHRHKHVHGTVSLNDVWPAVRPCQMAYDTEQSPTARYKTALLQTTRRRIYTLSGLFNLKISSLD